MGEVKMNGMYVCVGCCWEREVVRNIGSKRLVLVCMIVVIIFALDMTQ